MSDIKPSTTSIPNRRDGSAGAPKSDTLGADTPGNENSFLEMIKTLVFAMLIALCARSLVFQPFNIPSASMVPTLLVGDYLYVSKFAYGFSKHSFPFSPPLFDGRIWGAEPKRGDVIVFKIPKDNSTDFIKRLVGLPGDHIQVIHSEVYVNGEKLKREKIDEIVEVNARGYPDKVVRYRETMPNGASYIVYNHAEDGPLGNTEIFVVPEGHYFMMGDNRDNSLDSRVQLPNGPVGMVPFENLIGRAELIWYSTASDSPIYALWDWLPATRLSRIGTLLR